ncbi:MAG TPA: hypothetical protein VJT49_15915 [Amycolatopsis sp.]|uniref:hypothetical protein n=1 Tax=Amycolatopsis sp. TaxID=37632 RepID=UPI002B493459|nr:hypothetical protein [Amycolatopsis sp.]HKS46565.1 hypothetical protein [Amycolatopsis sp.]
MYRAPARTPADLCSSWTDSTGGRGDPFVSELVEDGAFRPGKTHEAAAEQVLDELARTARVMCRLSSGTN